MRLVVVSVLAKCPKNIHFRQRKSSVVKIRITLLNIYTVYNCYNCNQPALVLQPVANTT